MDLMLGQTYMPAHHLPSHLTASPCPPPLQCLPTFPCCCPCHLLPVLLPAALNNIVSSMPRDQFMPALGAHMALCHLPALPALCLASLATYLSYSHASFLPCHYALPSYLLDCLMHTSSPYTATCLHTTPPSLDPAFSLTLPCPALSPSITFPSFHAVYVPYKAHAFFLGQDRFTICMYIAPHFSLSFSSYYPSPYTAPPHIAACLPLTPPQHSFHHGLRCHARHACYHAWDLSSSRISISLNAVRTVLYAPSSAHRSAGLGQAVAWTALVVLDLAIFLPLHWLWHHGLAVICCLRHVSTAYMTYHRWQPLPYTNLLERTHMLTLLHTPLHLLAIPTCI